MGDAKQRYIRIKRPDLGGSYTVPLDDNLGVLRDEFDGSEPGDSVVLELVEMAQEEYDALPEFEGW